MAVGDIRDVAIVPHYYSGVYVCTLSVAPQAGDLLIAYEAHRSDPLNDWRTLPAGFVALPKQVVETTGTLLTAYKIATGLEGTSFTFEVTYADRERLALALIEGPLTFGDDAGQSSSGWSASYSTPALTVADDSVLVAAVVHGKGDTNIGGDSAWTTLDRGITDGTVYAPSSVFQTRTVTAGTFDADYTHAVSGSWASTIAAFTIDVTTPEDPTTDLPYEPPEPAGPILEIYTPDPGGARWGSAVWGTDVWAGGGWQDVTPQGVTADISWGSDDAAAGILATPQAGVWSIETYDPDRVLDPSNTAGPYYAALAPGLPIRISHRSTVLRTGIVETIDYTFADHVGLIRATDSALTMQAKVPDGSSLGDTVYDRIDDAINAAGIAVQLVRDSHDHAVAAEPDGELSVWAHVLNVAQERPRIVWIDRSGRLVLRRWSFPIERGRRITAANLVDLRIRVDDSSRYSVVRALDAAGSSTIERAYTPTPRYGRRIFERSEKTIIPEDWAALVLSDRAVPGVVILPGDVVPFTADEVEYFGTIEGGELVTVDTDELGAIDGTILGGRLRVMHRGGDLPYWRFAFYLVRASESLLIADATGDPLVSDADSDVALKAD